MADLDTAAADAPDTAGIAAPPDAAPTQDAAPEPSVAELASDMGWKPQDQWRGEPDKWKPAADFLRSTVDINRTLSREQKSMKQTLDRMASASAAIVEQQVAERVAAAEARFEAAVEAGDKNAARAATREIDRIQATPRADADPEATFAEANPWYEKHEGATALAVGISNRMARQGKSVAEQLEAAAAAVRETFPQLFNEGKPTPKAPPAVNSPATRTAAPSNRAKGVADLPPAARQAAESMARSMPGMTVEAYAKTYWSELAKEQAA